MWKNSLLEGEAIIIDGKKIKKQIWEGGKASISLPNDRHVFCENMVDEIIAYKEQIDKDLLNGIE